jgi:hypothetical protein
VIALALERDRARLRRCPGHHCAQLFVRWHRQRYCSKACQNRTAQARFERGHPTARRERYEARILARHPNAKIARRLRSQPSKLRS